MRACGCSPPAAFKTVKSLSASSPGHVLLLEYLEQRPLMMLQTGMGMRLTTYYRYAMMDCGWGGTGGKGEGSSTCMHTPAPHIVGMYLTTSYR